MKKILIILLIAISAGSCNFLDVEPEKSVTYTNYFKDEAEVEALFFYMFSLESGAFAAVEPTIHDIMGLKCDDIYTSHISMSGNMAMGFRNLDPSFFLNRDTDSRVSWKAYYDIIYIANMVLDNEYRFKNISDERKQFWLAQAWFAKRLAYFYIARTWGDAPIVPDSEYKDPLAKSPVKEVLEEALRCGEKALTLPKHNEPDMINSKGARITSKQYASLGTAYTLMANIYAWMGGLYDSEGYWTKAEECATKVIENKAGTYGLESIETLCDNVFGKTRQSNEIIFNIEISPIDRNYFTEINEWMFCPGQLLITYPVISSDTTRENDVISKFGLLGGNEPVEARIKYATVKTIYPESSDKRLSEFWFKFGKEKNNREDPENRYSYIYKWRMPIYSVNEEAKRPYLGVEGNKVIWRLADLILLRAECRARLGLTTAIDDLNRIRSRAGLGGYAGTGDLRKEVFRERERELFGEGQRYYAAVRNGYFSEISEAMGALTTNDINNGAIYLPVGEMAFKENSLMRQNIYWSWKN